ncbi:TIR domain-containing protein [Amycolatopsis sp. H20-H5]|uniref:TIR domain-containing protein n=1 Tax=Amycolatopsis sp. H20-H5 TaxID=3046309 RepID=UPI002DBFD844|nr:TIR domain-containing protein [Amycolatopsis sp. H20-H5]MEC3980279.1 TIR domain-containing protein [Amycolatopsis sp. H20-H5]
MSDFVSDQPAVQCFLSFTHADDERLRFVDPLTADLAYFCEADHGRKIEIFVDRVSIGWGGDWRKGIQDGIDAAMVFLPVITMNYFNESPWCRDELNAFHAKASALELTELILPLIIMGHDLLTGDNADASVQIIEKLQYLDIREAALAGPGSPEWRRAMVLVAGKLVKAIDAAEAKLAQRGSQTPALAGLPDDTGLADNEDAPGLHEYNDRLIASGYRLEAHAIEIIGDLNALKDAFARLLHNGGQRSPEQERVRSVRAAEAFKPLAVRIQRSGTAFESTVAEADSTIRSYLRLLVSHGSAEMLATARDEYREFAKTLGDLEGVELTLTEFLEQTRPLEVLSAPLRSATRPLRLGAQSIRLGVRTMRQLADLDLTRPL